MNSCLLGHSLPTLSVKTWRFALVLEVGDDLGETEHAHRDADEPDAVGEFRDLELNRATPELTSVPTSPSSNPSRIIAIAFTSEPEASTTAPIKPSTISEKYSAGPNLKASSTIGPASAARISVPTVPAKKRAECRNCERRAGAAASRHLVAVDAGHDRR